MTAVRTLSGVRKAIKEHLGAETLRQLHRENWAIDAVGVAASWGIVATLFVLLATLRFGVGWCACFLLQGFALQGLGLLSHDAFNHRQIWGDRWSWIGSMVSSFPVLLRPTWYRIAHRDHHIYLGTSRDTETYKQNLDAVWKRVLFLTIVGDRVAKLGRLSPHDARPLPVTPRTEQERRRLAIEGWALGGFVLAIALAFLFWPASVGCGFVLPLLIAAPIASTLRVILEHADADPGNDFHLGTYYRTGIVTRFLFLADSGDCHLIHHIFSQIPYYRMGRAAALMRPVLLSNGVIERRSLAQLLVGWLVRGYPHRSLWFPASHA